MAPEMPITNCPTCDQPMKAVRTLPKIGEAPALLVLFCSKCNDTDTVKITLDSQDDRTRRVP
jgi:hypothetical protein